MGPPSWRLICQAAHTMTGDTIAKRVADPTMSKVRLAQRRASCDRGRSRWSSGRPATGRTRMRSLETSVTPGAMITWTLSASRSQTRLRMASGASKAPPTKPTSRFVGADERGSLSTSPTWIPPSGLRCRPRWDQRAEDAYPSQVSRASTDATASTCSSLPTTTVRWARAPWRRARCSERRSRNRPATSRTGPIRKATMKNWRESWNFER